MTESRRGSAKESAGSIAGSPALAEFHVLLAADVLGDLERTRIDNENRLRALVQGKDGGSGLGSSPAAVRLHGLVEALARLEHEATLELKRSLRAHPLGPWVKRTIGVGEKQGARLLAAIGDPGERATVSQLWAYCGLHVLHPGQSPSDAHSCAARVGNSSDPTRMAAFPTVAPVGSDSLDVVGQQRTDTQRPTAGGIESSRPGQWAGEPQDINAGPSSSGAADQAANATHSCRVGGIAPRRARGQKANWNTTAKMRCFLVAESCIKQAASPYRAIYDAGRLKYADATHAHACPRCGPTGKPAPMGSPLSKGHQHARAMRLVMKAILRDLWVEARTVAGTQTAPVAPGAVRDSAAL